MTKRTSAKIVGNCFANSASASSRPAASCASRAKRVDDVDVSFCSRLGAARTADSKQNSSQIGARNDDDDDDFDVDDNDDNDVDDDDDDDDDDETLSSSASSTDRGASSAVDVLKYDKSEGETAP